MGMGSAGKQHNGFDFPNGFILTVLMCKQNLKSHQRKSSSSFALAWSAALQWSPQICAAKRGHILERKVNHKTQSQSVLLRGIKRMRSSSHFNSPTLGPKSVKKDSWQSLSLSLVWPIPHTVLAELFTELLFQEQWNVDVSTVLYNKLKSMMGLLQVCCRQLQKDLPAMLNTPF